MKLLHSIHLPYLSPRARALYDAYVAEGIDGDLAFELIASSLDETDLYTLEDENDE